VESGLTEPSDAAPAVRLAVLGPVVVTVDGVEHRPSAGRMRRILAVLAVAATAGRSVGVDELAEAVYGDSAPAQVRRSLFTEVWRCRRVLGGPETIVGDQDGYRLALELVDVDAVQFGALLGRGRQALDRADFPAAEQALAAALELWRGEPIPDWPDHPDGQAFVSRLFELHLGGAEDHAEALAATGRHAEAIAALEVITREHPVREHAWALLIDSFLAVGNQRRARSSLDAARRTLAEQGVDLGAELRAARELINSAGAGLLPPRPAATEDDDLLGRDGELARIVETGARALRESAPVAVLVAGEAGIGKTALVERAVQELARAGGARTALGRIGCDRRLNLPYAALRPLLRELQPHLDGSAPDVEAALDDPADPRAVAESLAEALEAAAAGLGGLVLTVEDVHWATLEVLDVLLVLLARRRATPLVLLVTVREPAGDAREEVRIAVAELRRRAALAVTLAGLDEQQSRRLLGPGAAPELLDAAHELTGGNPLYLRHLQGLGGGGRPTTLTEALDVHIDSLPIEVLRVLELAATIGTAFDTRVLTAAATQVNPPTPPQVVTQAVEIARAAGLLRAVPDDPRQWQFVHVLLRDRMYERAPAPERVNAHAAVARALGRLTGFDAPSPDLVAHHVFAGWPACPTDEAVTALAAAGREAGRELGFAEALGFFRQALDLIAMDATFDAPARVGELLAAAGQAAAAAADLAAARTAYAALRQHGERYGEPVAVLRGSLGLVQTFANERIDEDALDRLAAALDLVLAGAAGERDAAERWLVAEGVAVLTTYRPALARDLRRRAAAADPGAELALLARVWEQESPAEQASLLARMAELDGADPRLGTTMRRWITEVVIGTRAMGDAPPEWTPSDGTEPERWEAALWQITVAIATGHFERADRLLQKADELARRAGSPLEHAARAASLIGQRTWLAFLRADVERLLELVANNPPNWTVRRPIHRVMQTFSAAMLLSPEEAWQVCDAVVEEFLDGAAPGRHQLAPVIALSNGCIEVRHSRGIQLCRDVLRAARGQHAVYWVVQYWGCADYHLARLAAAAGDYDESIALFEESLAIYRAAGASCFEAFTIRALATVRYFRNRADDRRVAEALNREARRLGAQIGMPQVADAVWPPIGPLDLRPYVPLVLDDELAELDDAGGVVA